MLRHVTVEYDDRDLPGIVFLTRENFDKLTFNRSLHVRDGKSAYLVGHVALNIVLRHAVGILLSPDAESRDLVCPIGKSSTMSFWFVHAYAIIVGSPDSLLGLDMASHGKSIIHPPIPSQTRR